MQTAKKVVINDGYIEIHVSKNYIYDIPLNEFFHNDRAEYFSWYEHLRTKIWFDKETEENFVRAVAKYLLDNNGPTNIH